MNDNPVLINQIVDQIEEINRLRESCDEWKRAHHIEMVGREMAENHIKELRASLAENCGSMSTHSAEGNSFSYRTRALLAESRVDFWKVFTSSEVRNYGHLEPRQALEAMMNEIRQQAIREVAQIVKEAASDYCACEHELKCTAHRVEDEIVDAIRKLNPVGIRRKGMKKVKVQVVKHEGEEVVWESEAMGERQADRVDGGLNINLNHETHYTRIVEI